MTMNIPILREGVVIPCTSCTGPNSLWQWLWMFVRIPRQHPSRQHLKPRHVVQRNLLQCFQVPSMPRCADFALDRISLWKWARSKRLGRPNWRCSPGCRPIGWPNNSKPGTARKIETWIVNLLFKNIWSWLRPKHTVPEVVRLDASKTKSCALKPLQRLMCQLEGSCLQYRQ